MCTMYDRDNPFLRPPRAVSVIGRPNEPEETAGKDRDLLEADDAATTVVNRAQVSKGLEATS